MVYYVNGEGKEITSYEEVKKSLELEYGTEEGHCEGCKLPLVHISNLTISRDNIKVCLNQCCTENKHEV